MEMLKHRLEDESRARATADSRILEVGGVHLIKFNRQLYLSHFRRTKNSSWIYYSEEQ